MGEELRLPLCDRGPWVPATTTGNRGTGISVGIIPTEGALSVV